MKLKFCICTIFFVLLLFNSCGEKHKYNSSRKMLVRNEWKVSTFINYQENTLFDFGEIIYNFDDSGSLMRITNNDTVYAKWSLSNDSEYLTIDINVFKVTYLSRKTLSLRFGDFEMFFINSGK